MKIAVNAVNLKSAGGLTVALNFLRIVKSHHKEIFLDVFAPSGANYESYESENIKIHIIPSILESPLNRLVLDYTLLRRKIEETNADVIFTMGNFAIPSKLKQGVLFMYPYAIYPEEGSVWKLLSIKDHLDFRLRNILFKWRLKYANVFFPQTQSSKNRLEKYYPSIKKFVIIPMAYSLIGHGKIEKNELQINLEKGFRYLLCLTRYYVHKNLEVLISLAERIKTENYPLKIILTIDANQHENAMRLLTNIQKNRLDNIIINIGSVKVDQVPYLYSITDGLLLPTLLESFSATYVDALYFNKPIFTSDRDFAFDACGNCAYYFNPLSGNHMFETIKNAFDNPDLIAEKIELGKKRSNEFPNWEQVAEMYIDELRKMAIN